MTEKTPSLPKHLSIEELMEVCESLMSIENELKLDNELKRQTSIFFTVQRLLATETEALIHYHKIHASIELQRRRFFEGRLPPEYYRKEPLARPCSSKGEVDLSLKADPVFSEADQMLERAKARVSFLESVLWRIKERGNEIKAMIEWRKYVEAGI